MYVVLRVYNQLPIESFLIFYGMDFHRFNDLVADDFTSLSIQWTQIMENSINEWYTLIGNQRNKSIFAFFFFVLLAHHQNHAINIQ